MALLSFDATKVDPAKALEPVPDGWYEAKVVDTKIVPTKDGSGTRLNLTHEVLSGEFKGRKVFSGFNIKNQSEKAQEMAQKDLSALCHAVSVLNLRDTQQLHNIPHRIKVKLIPAREGYDAKNEIALGGYEPLNGAKMAGSSGSAALRPAGSGKPPVAAGAKPSAVAPKSPTASAPPKSGPKSGAKTAAAPTPAPVEEQVEEFTQQPWEQQDENVSQQEAEENSENGPWAQ